MFVKNPHKRYADFLFVLQNIEMLVQNVKLKVHNFQMRVHNFRVKVHKNQPREQNFQLFNLKFKVFTYFSQTFGVRSGFRIVEKFGDHISDARA